MSSNLPYRSRAVRALVLLHEEHLRRFAQTWRLAVATSVSLPPTADPSYSSLDALGRHVLSAAGGYLVWMCEVLTLPNPGVRPAPDAIAIVREGDDYMEHVLERWRAAPLREISDEQLEAPEYPSRWRTRYCIDSMLEQRCYASHTPHLPIGRVDQESLASRPGLTLQSPNRLSDGKVSSHENRLTRTYVSPGGWSPRQKLRPIGNDKSNCRQAILFG
jgi:hypothetical protein